MATEGPKGVTKKVFLSATCPDCRAGTHSECSYYFAHGSAKFVLCTCLGCSMTQMESAKKRWNSANEEYRCQFCEKTTPSQDWKNNKCPKCKCEYDAILAQEGDD